MEREVVDAETKEFGRNTVVGGLGGPEVADARRGVIGRPEISYLG